MATRKDLLKAQSFTSRRMNAAFVDRDPDDPTPPLRRIGTATFVSVLIGVVLLAGTALLGVVRGGTSDDSWKDQNNVILSDPESGALFVYLDGKLFPMADVASARLKAAGADPQGEPRVIEVKTEALVGVEQQPEFGIDGAPRQLPAVKDLHGHPLRLCSSASQGQDGRYLTLEFDSEASSSSGFAIVVEHSSRDQYLVFEGRAHKLYARPGNPSSLTAGLPIFKPGDGWIAALPSGPPIVPQTIPGYGQPGSERLRIGQMAVVEDGDRDRYYIQLSGGLSRISYLEMRAIQQDHDAEGEEPVPMTDVEVTRDLLPDRKIFTEDIPLDKPTPPPGNITSEDVSVCATFSADSPERVTLGVDQPTPEIASSAPPPVGQQIHYVNLPPLSGALLRRADAVTEDSATTLLLDGKGYSIPSMSARRALGYGGVTPVPVTGGLLNLLPPGLSGEGSALSLEQIGPTEK